MTKKSLLNIFIILILWIFSVILEQKNVNEIFLIFIYILIIIFLYLNLLSNKRIMAKVKKLNNLQKILFIILFILDIYILGIIDLFSNGIYFILFVFINYFLGFIFLKLRGNK